MRNILIVYYWVSKKGNGYGSTTADVNFDTPTFEAIRDMERQLCNTFNYSQVAIINIINLADAETLPITDVVEVVRCKDCKCYEKGSNESEGWEYCRRTGVNCNADDFCSYGERREK